MTVFLGGTCNPTTWRTDLAIPMLKNLGITYYNPQVEEWRPELLQLEWDAKEKADILFFVLDNQTRAIVVMIEVAFIAGSQRKPALVLVVDNAQPGSTILGETISETERQELGRGQSYLQEMVEHQGLPIFHQIPVALTCVARVLRNGNSPQELCCEDSAVSVQRSKNLDLSETEVRMRRLFDSLDNHNSGAISLVDLKLAFRILTDRELSSNSLRQIAIGQMNGRFKSDSDLRTKNLDDIKINFDEFCCIVTKFSSDMSTNICDNVSKKLSTMTQPIVDWFLKPSKTAINSGNSAPHMPYDTNYCDIYLGGSSSPSAVWRDAIAIPLLRKHGLSYYCSQSEGLFTDDPIIPIEAEAIAKSRVILFVITNDSRGLSAMITAAHYVALGFNIVLCIQYLSQDTIIDGKQLTETAIKDYNRGRAYLSDMASRSCVPVHEDIREAVISCVHKCFLSNVLLNKKSGR